MIRFSSMSQILRTGHAFWKMYVTADIEPWAIQETGWYDGQQFVKPPEVLARDRLLGTYEVTPVMKRLRGAMLSTGGSLLVASFLLATTTAIDEDGMYGRGAAAKPRVVTSSGVIYSKNVDDLSVFLEDDYAAAEEQAAMNGMPGYCGDRYYKAKSGQEEICNKFMSRRSSGQ